MKTVAHLLPEYNAFPPVIPAGTELRVEQVSLRQRRYRPAVICGHFPGQAERETIGAMNVRRIPVGRAYRRLFQKITRFDPRPFTGRMRTLVQEEGAAIVHVHNEPKLLPATDGLDIPIVVHVANEKPLDAARIERVTRWVAASEFIAGWLHERNAVPMERIRVIHTGVDVDRRPPVWSVEPARRQFLRERYGIVDPATRVILFAGRLVKEKGVAELLDAFERLREVSSWPLRLLVAGNVRASDDPKNEKAVYGRSVVERMEAMPDVNYVGSLHPAAIHDFLLAGDVFALPSLWDDPFPTVMLEAAAAGLPIVAAARGGVTEFLDGCEAFAFLDRPEDAQSLAGSLGRYVESPPDALAAGQWLRAKIESRFGWRRVADEFEDLYDELLEGARP